GLPSDTPAAISAFRAPYAAAFLLGALITRPFRPAPPFMFQQAMLAGVLVAAVLVLRPLLEKSLRIAMYVCGGLMVLHLAVQISEPPPRAEQVASIVQMAATAAVLTWLAGRLADGRTLGSTDPRLRKVGRYFLQVVALGCGVSAVAATFGF